jgi:virulence factor Mce-like protein
MAIMDKRPSKPKRVREKRSRGLDRERLALEIKRSSGAMLALLGLIALSITCIAIILANVGITLPWQSTYSRQVAVDNAKGVVAGDTVRLAGVTVGRITSVKLVSGRPILGIEMAPKYGPLYANATLSLRPETPLDDMYLDIISRGSKAAGALGTHQVLAAGRTETPVDISSVLDVFNSDTRSRVKQTIDNLGEALGNQGPSFEQALVDLAPFLSAAKQLTYQTAIRQTETRQLIHNFQLVTTALGSRNTQLRALVASGASTLTELGSNEGSVQAVVNQLPKTMSQLDSTFATVRATENHLDPAFTSLEPVARALPTALRDLTRFSTRATPAFTKLDVPLPVLNDLMHQLAPTAASLKQSFTALSPVPGELNTITQQVVPCEPALADFFQNTLSVGAYSTPLSTIIRGETVVGASSGAGAVQDQVAPKSCAPGGAS